MPSLEDQLKLLPDKPGVYLMKDQKGDIIYVGKAVSLKNRVRSYFQSSRNHSAKVSRMVEQIDSFETIVTDSEVEALILEANLIKKYRPKYNILLKDDKHYPYLKLTLNEPFPRMVIARSIKKDGARYFGPYPHAGAVREVMDLLHTLFPIRSCKKKLDGEKVGRPCLNFHIKRCQAPCTGDLSSHEYHKMFQQIILFLEGRQEDLIEELRRQMTEAAEKLEFERAAELRDKINAVHTVIEKQKIISSGLEDQDAIALARGVDTACVQVFFMRGGKIVGREHFFLNPGEESDRGEILASFVKQYYAGESFIPREIIVGEESDEWPLIEEWLTQKKGQRVYVKVPKRGEKFELVEMVAKNALLELERAEQAARREWEMTGEAVKQLAAYLHLPIPPYRIEAFDNSNIQGTDPVASMVVFEGGKPKRSDYRRFKIKTVEGPNDFASMNEVVGRRFRRAMQEMEEGVPPGEGKFSRLPDLLLIDGGKGQLSAARSILKELGFGHIPTVGLAKENEWLFTEGNPDPIILPRNSPALFLVQRVRDEAHRFAISFHRELRGKRTLRSILEEIPGIGPTRRRALLHHFGSLEEIKRASVVELAEVEGMNTKVAEEVYNFLRKRS